MDLLSNPTTKTNLAANRIYASPNLAAGNATFRALTESDLPLITSISSITPAYNDSLLIGDASPSQNGRATVSSVLSLGLEGHISGLEYEWVATNQIRVKTGICHIQNGGNIIKLASDSTKTISSLSANTFYYIYAFESSGALDWETSTTAPASPYFGTARSMSGNPSRRFLGFFLTNASSQIVNFSFDAEQTTLTYEIDFTLTPFRVLGPAFGLGGNETAWTTKSVSAVVPPFCTKILARILNYGPGSPDTTFSAFISIPGDTGTRRLFMNPDTEAPYTVALNSSQQFAFQLQFAPTGVGGLYFDIREIIFKGR